MANPFQAHWYGDYELLNLLGIGGMAEVFLARTMGAQGFEKVVVVKRMLARLSRDERFVNMFVDEAKMAVQLQHSNIVQILSLEEHEGRPFIVMEYVHGKDLFNVLSRAHQDRTELPVDFGIHCIVEMLRGLGYAHNATGPDGNPLNLIHRDVTPSNVFISFDGQVKLGDFGVAHSEGKVKSTEVRGKLSYLAPEALSSGHLDHRADLFSAGVVLWETLSQRRLFGSTSAVATLTQIRDRVPEPPSTHNPNVPPDLDRITAKALEKDPNNRYSSAAEFEEALSDFLFARGLRWTGRRIAEVMKARFPVESKPLVLPPPTARTILPPEDEPEDFEDETTRRLAKVMDGLDQTPEMPPGGQLESQPRWTETIESSLNQYEVPDTVIENQRAQETSAGQLAIHLRGQPIPHVLDLAGMVKLLTSPQNDVESVGFPAGRQLGLSDLSKLLYWESLFPVVEPNRQPAAEGVFQEVGLTRLLYELTVRRTTGMVSFEGGQGPWRRLLYIEGGYPLYVCSDHPNDGALAMIVRHSMIDREVVLRAMWHVINDGMSLDRALHAVIGGEERKRVERIFSAIVRSRLYTVFSWKDGRFKVFADAPPPVRLSTPVPPLLGILVRGVARSFSLEELQVQLQLRGQRAVLMTDGREQHIRALRLKRTDKAVIQAIDGKRNLMQVLQQVGADSQESMHAALAVLYVLSETRIIELI